MKHISLKGKTLKSLTLIALSGLAFSVSASANIMGFLPYKACYDAASRYYGIPERLLIAISYVESDFNPLAINHNSNGTTDYGIMQVNTANIIDLGLDRNRLLTDPCYNIASGAAILKQCINTYGFNWRAISCYNAGHLWNPSYVRKVYSALTKVNWVFTRYALADNYPVYSNAMYFSINGLKSKNVLNDNGYFTVEGVR